MGDEWHLPDNSRAQQTFYYTGAWQTWPKPRGILMAHFLIIGAGAGGACGFSGSTSTLRGGGSGGACGAQVMAVIPAAFLPDLLYIGVAAGTPGTVAGTLSQSASAAVTYVSYNPNSTGQYLLSASGGFGANPGTSSAGGTATANPSVTVGFLPLLYYAPSASNAGLAGSTSGTAAAPALTLAQIASPGTGGGTATAANADSAGGLISSWLPSVPVAVPGGTAGGGRGADGFSTPRPLLFLPGTGGGSNAAGTGGAGGNGATGSGGGGGGGGLTGGAGGNGGSGLVIITCF